MPLPLAAFLRRPAPAAPWTPANLTVPPMAWYSAFDPADMTLLTPSRIPPYTHKVAAFLDKSGNGIDMVCAPGGEMDYPAALGAGAGAHWWSPGLAPQMDDPGSPGASKNWAVAVVSFHDGNVAGSQYLLDTTTSGSRLQLAFDFGTANAYAVNDGVWRSLGTPLTAGSHIAVFDLVAPSSGGFWLNGTADPSNPFSYAQRSFSAGTSLFTRADGALGAVAGTLFGEMVIVPGGFASTSDRQKLEGYLAHKWGLAANLAAGHPYKSSAP